MNKSEKFRELLAKEKSLRNQLDDCKTAQSRMLKKAFKNLGLRVGCFGEMIGGKADVMVIGITDFSVDYYRHPDFSIETYEITFEDLFDAEVE